MRREAGFLQAARGERGMSMAVALFAMAALLVLTASGLLLASANVRATRNYRAAAQAHFVAESGLIDALVAINGPGVIDLGREVVERWGEVYGNATRSFSALPGFGYTVAALSDPADPANRAFLRATATGPEGTRKVVAATLLRSDIPSTAPGAIYLAADAPSVAAFKGNAFTIDGNDHDLSGAPGPGVAVAGIATRNQANAEATVASLADAQRDNVRGLGFLAGSPAVPSILALPAAPSASHLDQMVNALLSRPGVVTYTDSQIAGNATFGTPAAPQITHFAGSGGVTIRGGGNASGAGIMIVDGDLTIQGNLSFAGLVIVRGSTEIQASAETELSGNATVYGSLWTTSLLLTVGGSATIAYSTEALALADASGGGGALPAPVSIVALADCTQVAPGTGGCP